MVSGSPVVLPKYEYFVKISGVPERESCQKGYEGQPVVGVDCAPELAAALGEALHAAGLPE